MTTTQLKISAHSVFDRIWKTRRMTRNAAYRWLGDLFGLPRERAHIKYLNRAQLVELIEWSSNLLETIPKPHRRRA